MSARVQAYPRTAARNAAILHMGLNGDSATAIARKFGVSRSRIHQIYRREKARSDLARTTEDLRRRFEISRDVDTKLPVTALLSLLIPPGPLHERIRTCLTGLQLHEMSIRDMMDFLLPGKPQPKNLFEAMPLLRLPHMGVLSFIAVANHMTALAHGSSVEDEWRQRMDGLQSYLRLCMADRRLCVELKSHTHQLLAL